MGWLPMNIKDSNAISSGNKGVQGSDLTIVFKFNSERKFGIGDVKGIVKGSDSIRKLMFLSFLTRKRFYILICSRIV